MLLGGSNLSVEKSPGRLKTSQSGATDQCVGESYGFSVDNVDLQLESYRNPINSLI